MVGGVQTGLTVVVHEPGHASKIPPPYGVLDLLPHIGGGQGVAGGLLLIAEITVELRQQLQHLSPLGARGGAAAGGGFHVLLVADLGVPGQDPRPRGVVLTEGLGKDLLHDGLHRQSEVAVVCHAEVVKHLSEEEVVIPAPVAASHVVDAHIGDGTRIEQVFHLGQQGSASALGVAAPFLGGGLLHVPHGGPMLDRLNPAQRVEPRVLQIEVGVGKGLVQVFIRGLDVKIFKLLAVEFLDSTQLGGGVKGSQIHSLLPVIGEAQHDPSLALRGIALREGATFFSVMSLFPQVTTRLPSLQPSRRMMTAEPSSARVAEPFSQSMCCPRICSLGEKCMKASPPLPKRRKMPGISLMIWSTAPPRRRSSSGRRMGYSSQVTL